MSNLGFLSLYHRLNSVDGIRVYRVFFERGSLIYSPDAKTPGDSSIDLSSFDALFFSISFEMDYLNVLKMLEKSNIKALSEKRPYTDPVIVTGGITVTSNPDVLSVISDVVYSGDMEVGLPLMIELLFKYRFRKNPDLIGEIRQVKGVYNSDSTASDESNRVSKNIYSRCTVDKVEEPAHSVIISNQTVFSNRFLIEIARGCKNSCKFCMTRVANFPPRHVESERIIELCEIASNITRNVGFIAPVVTDNPDLLHIVEELNRMNMAVSFSSMRADRFNDEIAETIVKNRQRSVTFAPETGSDRLRRRIGKVVKNERILESVKIALNYGIRNIRYYFMYGLPGESYDDIKEIAELVRKTLDILGRNGRLHLSINPFIPKRGTPFQGMKLFPPEYYREMKEYLSIRLSDIGEINSNLTYKFESLKTIYTHHALSVGGADVGYYLAVDLKKKKIREIEKFFMELSAEG